MAHGTADIAPGRGRVVALEATQITRMKVECVPTAGDEEPYAVYVVDEANAALLKSPNPEKVQKLASQEGSGKVIINQMSVGAGTYYVVVDNPGSSSLAVKYNVFELPQN